MMEIYKNSAKFNSTSQSLADQTSLIQKKAGSLTIKYMKMTAGKLWISYAMIVPKWIETQNIETQKPLDQEIYQH